jgi:hypothetical protein
MSSTFRWLLLLPDRNEKCGCISVYIHVSKTHRVEGEGFSIASGVGLSPLYCGHFWPFVSAPDDRWGWLWSNWWNEDWQGKPKYSDKTCPSATLFTTNHTSPDPGSNPGRRSGKPTTNRLSYGAALRVRVSSPSGLIWTVEKKSYALKALAFLRATEYTRRPFASWVTKHSPENNEQLFLFLQLLVANETGNKLVIHEIKVHFNVYKTCCVVLIKEHMRRWSWKLSDQENIDLSLMV